MMWPSSFASKVLIFLLITAIVYFIYMDTLLILRIQNYRLDIFGNAHVNSSVKSILKKKSNYEEVLWVSCSINPLCYPTVKALMLDHVNHYIYGPFCSIVDIELGISKRWLFLTPNMISLLHVFVAFIGAKLLTGQSLTVRRLAVILFQIRMFLDDLDGLVARERRHIKGERSEVGTAGYLVDGFSDLAGVIAMVIGVLVYLKNNPPRRGYRDTTVNTIAYHLVKNINISEDLEEGHAEIGIIYKTKATLQWIVKVLGLFSVQMFISSVAWNRYIDIYQELLEDCADCDVERRETMFQSGLFFFATSLWRIMNPQSYLHVLSLAVFCDKTWGFLKAVHYRGFVCLVIAAGASECLIYTINAVIRS